MTHTVKAITLATAGSNATYCPGAVASLSGNTPGSNETGVWSGGGNGITINNITNPTSPLTIAAGASGTATLTWTITNSDGCSSSAQVVITNRGGVTPVTAGANQILSQCYSSTQSTTLNGSYGGSGIDGQIGTWSIVSGPNIPNITNPNANNTSVTNLIQGTYVFRWTVTGPCASGTATVQVTVPAPTSDITQSGIIGGSQVFCDPTIISTVLTGTTPQYINETVTWSQTSGPAATIVSPNSPVTSITGLASPNSYTFLYTINNAVTGCSSSASATVSYLPSPPTLTITTPNPVITPCDSSAASISFIQGGWVPRNIRF